MMHAWGDNGHDPNVHPIKFVWNLMDYEILKMNNDNDVMENVFQQIIGTNT